MPEFPSADPAVFQKWVHDSTTIYQKFAGEMYRGCRAGMNPDPFVTERKGGYYLFRRVDPELAYLVEHVGRVIHKIAPEVLVYPGDVLHTTYTDFRVASGFDPSTDQDHHHVLQAFDTIASGIAKLTERRKLCAAATYGEVLFGLNAFVLEGFSCDSSHLDDSLFMQEEGKRLLGVELRLPWGAHVSFGRVASPISAEKVRKLADYCRSLYPVTVDRIYPYVGVEAGWYTVSPEGGFQAHITSSYPFK